MGLRNLRPGHNETDDFQGHESQTRCSQSEACSQGKSQRELAPSALASLSCGKIRLTPYIIKLPKTPPLQLKCARFPVFCLTHSFFEFVPAWGPGSSAVFQGEQIKGQDNCERGTGVSRREILSRMVLHSFGSKCTVLSVSLCFVSCQGCFSATTTAAKRNPSVRGITVTTSG